jgi:hypothetical protein
MFLLVIGSSAVALRIIARLSRTGRLFNQRQRRWWLLGGELMLSGGLFA